MFDVIIVGGGPAGLSAALMLGRCRRRVLLCDAGEPRNARSRAVHGFLTRDGLPPRELHSMGRRELGQYGVEIKDITVTGLTRGSHGFSVDMADGEVREGRFLLIATGVVDDVPDLPGVGDCYGTSVFHCPYCDGWEQRDRRLVALGRDRSGTQLALSLLTWSPDVTLCTNGQRLAERARQRLRRNGVTVVEDPITECAHHEGRLREVRFADRPPLQTDALFFTTGQRPRCELAARLGCGFNNKGTVVTTLLGETNVPGVFVAGDASHDAQFVVVAAAEGAKAGLAINQALQRLELKA